MREIQLLGGLFVLQPMHHRAPNKPLEVNYNGGIHHQLEEETQGGELVTHTNVRDIANKIIVPSAHSDGHRDIFGGWDEQHIAGYLFFRITSPAEVRDEMYTVYSDRFDMSYGKHLDPRVRFKIDSRRIIRSNLNSRAVTSTGRMTKDFINLQPVNVISHNEVRTSDDLGRPSDSLHQVQKIITGASYSDTRSKATISGVEANGLDSDAGVYLSNVMNAFKGAKAENELSAFGYGDPTAVIESAACTLKKTHNQESAVKDVLQKRTSFLEAGSFEYGELCKVFPNAESVCKMGGAVSGQMESLRDQSSDMLGADNLSNFIFRLNDRICKELACRGILEITFNVSQDVTGMPVVAASDSSAMFEDIGLNDHMRSVNEVLNDIQIFITSILSDYGSSIVMHECTITAFSYNKYNIRIDQNSNTFSAPAFCNGLMSSFVMNNQEGLYNLAGGMYGIIKEVYEKEPNQKIVSGQGIDLQNEYSYQTPATTKFDDQGFRPIEQSSSQPSNDSGSDINFLI